MGAQGTMTLWGWVTLPRLEDKSPVAIRDSHGIKLPDSYLVQESPAWVRHPAQPTLHGLLGRAGGWPRLPPCTSLSPPAVEEMPLLCSILWGS